MRVSALLVFFAVALLLPLNSQAQRVAWVVGNSDYADGTLPNPVNDAKLVSDSLEALGFQVQLDLNLKTAKEFGTSAREVLSGIDSAEVVLFYYAGHGIQVNNENYLIPTEAAPQDEAEVNRECFAIKELINLYQKAYSEIPFVAVLDACRVNPFERKWSRSYGSGKGLSEMSAPTGSLIAYSTEYGTTAADGNMANSDFALAFAETIGQPGLSIQEAFTEVRRLVLEASNGVQVPVEESKLTAPLILRELPDINDAELSLELDNFEKNLIRGFRQNAELFQDTTRFDLTEQFGVVKHYVSRLDSSRQDLHSRWTNLWVFFNLHRLQNWRGFNDDKEYEYMEKVMRENASLLDHEVAAIAQKYIAFIKLFNGTITQSEFKASGGNIENQELRFALSVLVGDPSNDMFLTGKIDSSNNYKELIEALTRTEFLLAFEICALGLRVEDNVTYSLEFATEGWKAKNVLQCLNLHRQLTSEMSNVQDKAYWYCGQLAAIEQVLTPPIYSDEKSTNEKLKGLIRGYLSEHGTELISNIFSVDLDYDNFPLVADNVEGVLTAVNNMIESEELELSEEASLVFEEFFARELGKSKDECSVSVFDFFLEGARMAINGNEPLKRFLERESMTLIQDVNHWWACFLDNYAVDEESSDLHIGIDNLLQFWEQSWLREDDGLEIGSVYSRTDRYFKDLSQKQFDLLRLSNKVLSREFAHGSVRMARILDDNSSLEGGSLRVLEDLEEYHKNLGSFLNYRRASHHDMHGYFVDEDHEDLFDYVLIFVNEIVFEDLEYSELIRLERVFREVLFLSIDKSMESDQKGMPALQLNTKAEYHHVIPSMLLKYKELVEEMKSRGLDVFFKQEPISHELINLYFNLTESEDVFQCLYHILGSPRVLYLTNDSLLQLGLNGLVQNAAIQGYDRNTIDLAPFVDYTLLIANLWYIDGCDWHDDSVCEDQLYVIEDLMPAWEKALDASSKIDKGQTLKNRMVRVLYEFVESTTQLPYESDSENSELYDEVVGDAIDRMLEIRKKGKGSDDAVDGLLPFALQTYFHWSGRRLEGASTTVDAALHSLKGHPEGETAAQLHYILAEEESCLSNYESSIPYWRICMDDYYHWETDDHNQFAQNLFLDLLEYEGVSDTHYEELFEAIGLSANELEGNLTSSDLDGSVLTLQAAVEDAWPIVEFTNASGQNTLMFQRPDLQWKVLEWNQKLGAIMTLRDTAHVACHGYSYGQIDVSDPNLGEDIVVFSNQTSRDSFSEWKILLPEMLGSMTDVSSIRTGFYWGGLPPTGHTQDLKYLTYLKSYNFQP